MRSANIGENKWCDPTVLSILTGKTTDECASVLSQVTGRRNITEVYWSELKKALDYMRYEYKEVAADCSLYSLFMQIAPTSGFYIVEVPRHVVAVEVTEQHKVLLCDNHTKEPINGAASARLGQRALLALKVTPKPEPVFIRDEIEVIMNNQSFRNGNINVPYTYAHVSVWSIYEKEEDNSRREIGTLRAKSDEELREVCNKLLEKLK